MTDPTISAEKNEEYEERRRLARKPALPEQQDDEVERAPLLDSQLADPTPQKFTTETTPTSYPILANGVSNATTSDANDTTIRTTAAKSEAQGGDDTPCSTCLGGAYSFRDMAEILLRTAKDALPGATETFLVVDT